VDDYFYLRHDGADMPVYVEGSTLGNTFVIVLHGGPGGDAHVYNQGMAEFSHRMEEEVAMVYYDQRGSGVSKGKFEQGDLSEEQFAEDLHQLILLLKQKYGDNQSIFLMGHSWGGTLGTKYILTGNYQNHIDGWIEVDGAHNFIGAGEMVRHFIEVGNKQVEAGNSEDFWNEVMNFSREVDTLNPTDQDLSKLNEYGYEAESKLSEAGVIQISSDINPFVYLGGLRNYYTNSGYDPITGKVNSFFTNSGFGMFDIVKTLDYTGQLGQITVPTLLIWGEYDMVVPPELGKQAYNKLGSSTKELVIFKNCGHSPMMNYPKEFADKLLEFIDQNK
jgi:pimeloyl-ACP methyl ester carboxylesterase